MPHAKYLFKETLKQIYSLVTIFQIVNTICLITGYS
jgi:hypothetical protein